MVEVRKLFVIVFCWGAATYLNDLQPQKEFFLVSSIQLLQSVVLVNHPFLLLFDAEENKDDGIIDAAVPITADVFIKFLRFIDVFILTPY